MEKLYSSNDNHSKSWYAIYTRSRCEKKMYESLQKDGFEVFLPLKEEERIWSDRIKRVSVPILPSYLFIKAKEINLTEVYKYPWFVNFVKIGNQLGVVKESEIAILKKLSENDFSVYSVSDCTVGDTIEVIRGPLKGLQGKVSKLLNDCKVLFQLQSIQLTLCVEVSRRNIQLI